jgi:hypothetical protein
VFIQVKWFFIKYLWDISGRNLPYRKTDPGLNIINFFGTDNLGQSI